MLLFLAIAVICAVFFGLSLFVDVFDLGDHAGGGHDGHDSVFSIRSLLLFGVGFGAIGMIARANGWSIGLASLYGGVAGLTFAWVGYRVSRFMQDQEGDSTPSADDVIGQDAVVTIAIPAGGAGQIAVRSRRGFTSYMLARSARAQPEDGRVVVRQVIGTDAIVE